MLRVFARVRDQRRADLFIAGAAALEDLHYRLQVRIIIPPVSTGYTNGRFRYIPTLAAAVRGGYGADSVNSQVEPGTGERMLNAGLISLYELMGKLSSKPAEGETEGGGRE